jgi:hypothetical protein
MKNNVPWRQFAVASIGDAINRDQARVTAALSFCLGMIFSENRSPLFRIMP